MNKQAAEMVRRMAEIALQAIDYVGYANFPERQEHAEYQIDIAMTNLMRDESASFKEVGNCDECQCGECVLVRKEVRL